MDTELLALEDLSNFSQLGACMVFRIFINLYYESLLQLMHDKDKILSVCLSVNEVMSQTWSSQ